MFHFLITMSKDATSIKTEAVSTNETKGKAFDFVYQNSNYFYIYVVERNDIKAAFEILKKEAVRYYTVALERDKKTLEAVSKNLARLQVSDDLNQMDTYYQG